MKRLCSEIDLRDWEVVYPWVEECIKRHPNRYDFLHLLQRIGKLPKNYKELSDDERVEQWNLAIERISKCAVDGVAKRNIQLNPVRINERQDKSSLKWRMIGRESAMQQIYDFIAVRAADDIWKKRYVLQQSSSIKSRGQIYGTNMISKWVNADYRAYRYAKSHGLKYYRKCKYYVKLDVQKCFQSMRKDKFMRLFERDCKNQDLIWLWNFLLDLYKVHVNGDGELYEGFMIGALPSQMAAQYMLSFVYRYAMNLHRMRRNKRIKYVTHMELFMDDIFMSSTSRSNLKTAVKSVIKYMDEELGLTVKPNWHIHNINRTPIDMMGFLVFKDGAVSIRERIYERAKRLALRIRRKGSMSYRQAKRIIAYKGYFIIKKYRVPLKTRRVMKKLGLANIFEQAAKLLSKHERRLSNDNLLFNCA